MSDLPSPSSPSSDPAAQPSRLENEPEKRPLFRPWLLAVVGLFVGYPFSVGPAIWLSRMLDPDQKHVLVLMWIFAPLEFLHRTVAPIRAFYDWYLSFFGVR